MLYRALKAKIHRARITKTRLDYPGSIGIDPNLLNAAGILPYEAVLVANITNGNRIETYVVPAEKGSGDIIILGAAAKLFDPGDIVIIMNFAFFTPEEMKTLKPKIVVPDENNRPTG